MYNCPEITKVIEEAKTIIGDVKDIPNNEEGRQMIEKIATALFSKLKSFDVKKINIHDIDSVRYYAFEVLKYNRPVESTMIIDITLSNDITFNFGYGNNEGDDRGAMGVTLPGSSMEFLCKHRIDTLAAWPFGWCPYSAEINRNLWLKVAEIFEMKLVDFESFIQLAATVLGKATGIISSLDSIDFEYPSSEKENWVFQFKAPVKTEVITYEWN
jgi:hypothetical protein